MKISTTTTSCKALALCLLIINTPDVFAYIGSNAFKININEIGYANMSIVKNSKVIYPINYFCSNFNNCLLEVNKSYGDIESGENRDVLTMRINDANKNENYCDVDIKAVRWDGPWGGYNYASVITDVRCYGLVYADNFKLHDFNNHAIDMHILR